MANEIIRSAENSPANVGNTLADILERVLDKGIVIAGDIVIQLADIDLLTIKIRLLVTSADKAKELGIDWWEHDPFLSSPKNELSGPERRKLDSGKEKSKK